MKRQSHLLVLFLLGFNSYAQQRISFRNLTSEDGLTNGPVFEILRDSYGFMWFGTTDGLNKFDGSDFENFQHVPGDTSGLPDNSIWALLEDSKGNLWVGTDGGGLSLYDRQKDAFISFHNDPENPESLPGNSVNVIFEDSDRNLWIGTYGGGLSKLIEPGRFQNFVFNEEDPHSISNNFIHHLFEDSRGRLWVGTRAGLNRYDEETGRFIKYRADDTNPLSLSNDNVLAITEDQDGRLWLGSWGGGLSSFHSDTGVFRHHQFDDIGLNRVTTVYIDSFNNIWAGFLGKGLVRVDRNTGELVTSLNDRTDPESIVNDNVWFIYEDELENLWVGTEGGISWFDLKEKPIRAVGPALHQPAFENTVSTGFSENSNGEILFGTEEKVGVIRRAGEGVVLEELVKVSDIWSFVTGDDLWVSSYGSGLYRFEKNEDEYELKRNYRDIEKTTLENATYLFKGSKGKIWLGTYGNGLVSYDPVTDNFEVFFLTDLTDADPPPILTIYEDDADNLWIGTYSEGLIRFNKKTGAFERFVMEEGENSISHNTILCATQGENGIMWIGTDGGGLNSLDTKTGRFNIVTTRDGLPGNVVLGILIDSKNNLWLSTNKGLTRYNTEDKTVEVYDSSHGLVSGVFNADAYFADTKGVFYFGSGNGFSIFHPDSIRPSTTIPPVFFSDLKVLNKTVGLSEGLLSKHINFEESITLSHDQNFFSLGFVALEYSAPSKNNYAYKLEGFNDDWIYTDASNRQATFTNIDQGDYILKVKASNSDGIWGDNEASLNIKILPPPWKTWWAYCIYSITFLVLTGMIFRTVMARQRLKASLLLEQFERKKMEELDQMKSRFFAGISHEFRTPLTLIAAPVKQLLKKYRNDEKTEWSLKLVTRNAERLLRLINQLLDLSKLEAGKLKLQVSKSDVISWIKIVTASFESLAKNKKTEFRTSFPEESLMMFFDKEKLEQVIGNLLSNAFRFSESIIAISVSLNEGNLQVEVTNDGTLISPEEQHKIFDRFYQASGNRNSAEGTGIGLALVKELTELHHGFAEVRSEEGRMIFTISIPVADSIYENDERVSLQETEVSRVIQQQDAESESDSNHETDADRSEVLVVEDNTDLRRYITTQLSEEYKVYEAVDGREGLDIAFSEIPDLIITDVMMPEIDGIQLLHSLREDPKTNHIPIIMLTAKAEKETKLEGIEKGADHYINKPFDMDELEVRVGSLLNQRERIRSHYYNEFLISPKTEDIPSMDDRFLENAVKIIDDQLDNHEFSVDLFARELAVSRVQLHRKLKAIIGCSASEFIRHYRLKKAYQYLENRKGSVSQIAYSVGFNNLSYFTKAFREIYHINPSELLK